MRVILIKSVSNLGKVGALVDVKDGYALNYLIPNGLAQDATSKTLAKMKSQQEQETRKQTKVQESNAKVKRVIAGQTVIVLSKANEVGKLFAAIGTQDVCLAIQKKFNLPVEPRFIKIPQPIKTVGQHEVLLKIDNEEVKFWVVVEKV
jgi:large subunit ribosomal protein L9